MGWTSTTTSSWRKWRTAASGWMAGWIRPAAKPPFGEIELLPEELLPRAALDDVPPDEQRVHEASGNEGVSVERAYRRAAFVLWPRSKTLAIVSSGGIDGAIAWVAAELDPNAGGADERIRALVSRLIDVWPTGPTTTRNAQGRARMLHLLCTTGDEDQAARFLREVVLARYDGSGERSPRGRRGHDRTICRPALPARPRQRASPAAADGHACAPPLPRRDARRIVGLRLAHRSAGHRPRGPAGLARRVAAGAGAERPRADRPATGAVRRRGRSRPLHARLALRLGGRGRNGRRRRRRPAGDRHAGPDASRGAGQACTSRRGAAGSSAFALLWCHAADFLLARSAKPPEEPRDWTIGANVGCRCEHCSRLRNFCKDPAARTARFPLRKDLRAHLHQTIDRRGLDIEHVTERRGRPFTLVCTKTRAGYQRRLAEYAEDVSCMRGLIGSVPAWGAGPSAPHRTSPGCARP